MGNEFLKMINTRRSCRKYRKEQITDEELNAILEAGTYAPTGMGAAIPLYRSCPKSGNESTIGEDECGSPWIER